MSARKATVLPLDPPSMKPTTPVLAILALWGIPISCKYCTILSRVRYSSIPSSGWRWKSRRTSTSHGFMASAISHNCLCTIGNNTLFDHSFSTWRVRSRHQQQRQGRSLWPALTRHNAKKPFRSSTRPSLSLYDPLRLPMPLSLDKRRPCHSFVLFIIT